MTPAQRRAVQHSFLFDGTPLTPAVLALLETCPQREYARGEEIFSPERFTRAAGVLLAGQAQVVKRHGVVLNTLGPSDCFGVARLYTEDVRYVSTVLAARTTRVLFLDAAALEELFRLDGAIGMRYIRFLSDRIRFLNRKVDAFTSASPEDRLVAWLLERAQGPAVEIPAGYSALARDLGIGRTSLYRCLAALEEEGLIRRADREITLLDRSRLQARLAPEEAPRSVSGPNDRNSEKESQ